MVELGGSSVEGEIEDGEAGREEGGRRRGETGRGSGREERGQAVGRGVWCEAEGRRAEDGRERRTVRARSESGLLPMRSVLPASRGSALTSFFR